MKSIVVHDWAALAGGLTSRPAWLEWARQAAPPVMLEVPVSPDIEAMPPMLRRRIGLTGRIACAVAHAVEPQAAGSPVAAGPDSAGQAPAGREVPLVLASRYGDAPRALALLAELVNQHSVSPTGFTLGVHNAIGALYAIARGSTANMQVVTAGRQTVRAGVLEALGLLADGASEVLLVNYDTPLPEPYTCFHDQPMPAHAWAWRLGAGRPGDVQAIALHWHDRMQGLYAPTWAHAAVDVPGTPLDNPSLATLWQFLRLQAQPGAHPRELWL